MSTTQSHEPTSSSRVRGSGLIPYPKGDSIDLEKLITDTATYWGMKPESFRTGEVSEGSALSVFASEWQEARKKRPDNLHLAYVDAIRSTTQKSCGDRIWDFSKFPKTSYDIIKYKTVLRVADNQLALERGEGPRSHVHALHVDKPTLLQVEYWEVDEMEPKLQIVELDRQTGLTKISVF